MNKYESTLPWNAFTQDLWLLVFEKSILYIAMKKIDVFFRFIPSPGDKDFHKLESTLPENSSFKFPGKLAFYLKKKHIFKAFDKQIIFWTNV